MIQMDRVTYRNGKGQAGQEAQREIGRKKERGTEN